MQASFHWVIGPSRSLCRYFSVYIASPANELSRERRDQTQGAAEEAAGCLLRQVRPCLHASPTLKVFFVIVCSSTPIFFFKAKRFYFLLSLFSVLLQEHSS